MVLASLPRKLPDNLQLPAAYRQAILIYLQFVKVDLQGQDPSPDLLPQGIYAFDAFAPAGKTKALDISFSQAMGERAKIGLGVDNGNIDQFPSSHGSRRLRSNSRRRTVQAYNLLAVL